MEKEYLEHPVFDQLSKYAKFYNDLAFSIMGFMSMGIRSSINMNTYFYSSMQGTLESIRDILLKKRINDAYALLRKYFDAAITNIYVNLYLEDNFNTENFVVEKIDNWMTGKEKMPYINDMKEFIQKSGRVTNIYKLLDEDIRYEELRKRCNDHTHYNSYYNVLLNDNEVSLKNRISTLNQFSNDLVDVFIYHLSYLFYFNDHYMVASDYIDCLDCGLIPKPNSQYWVAPFIQDIFDDVIKKRRIDLVTEIKRNTSMMLK